MSKEAMKLALEALEDTLSDDPYPYSLESKAISALREALAEPDFWDGYVPEPVKPATTETNGGKTGWPPGLLQDDCKGLSKWLSNKPDAKRRVREALDKMAENARELGLDYEPAHQEPVALFKWLPEGATHIGRISVRTSSGGSLAMTAHAFKYDNAVLKVYVTDNDNEYPGWRDAKDCFFHLNFPVLPLYTSPPAQRTWVSLTNNELQPIADEYRILFGGWVEDFARAIEAKLKEKNT